MSGRPIELPRWADSPGGADTGTIEPPEGLKARGWNNGEQPAAGHFNWLLKQLVDWARFDAIARLIDTWALGPRQASIPSLIRDVAGGLESTTSQLLGTYWVAVGDADAGNGGLVMWSRDGRNWTQETTPSDEDLRAVVYHDNINQPTWVAVGVGGGGDAYIVTREPDTAWNERANPKDFDLYAVASNGDDTLIAAGEHDGTDIYAIKSTDHGVTWAELAGVTGAAGAQVNAIAYAPELDMWALGGQDSGGAPSMHTTSDDGANFSARTLDGAATGVVRAMVWTGTAFIAVCDDSEIHRSTDGVTWALVYNDLTSFEFLDVACQRVDSKVAGLPPAAMLVAVAQGTGGRRVMYSGDDGLTWDAIPNHPELPEYVNNHWRWVAAYKGFLLLAQDTADSDIQAATGPALIGWPPT